MPKKCVRNMYTAPMAKEHSPLLFTFEHIPLSHHYHLHSPWAGKDLQSPFIVHLGRVYNVIKEEAMEEER